MLVSSKSTLAAVAMVFYRRARAAKAAPSPSGYSLTYLTLVVSAHRIGENTRVQGKMKLVGSEARLVLLMLSGQPARLH